jgi:hypothetical protein
MTPVMNLLTVRWAIPRGFMAIVLAALAPQAGAMRDRSSGPAYGSYAWPVKGAVIRGFEEPKDPYGAGHRGIDIAVPFGTAMVASQDGTVSFAGWVAGSLFISIDHADGVRTTYSWLSAVLVSKGDQVGRGALIGNTGQGHPSVPTPHLHFGARVGSTYLDPMLLLEGADVVGLIHLAPLQEGAFFRADGFLRASSADRLVPAPARSWAAGSLYRGEWHRRRVGEARGPPARPWPLQ